jgi:2-oxoglutarate ferredoxin oxidoreductase subunit beta
MFALGSGARFIARGIDVHKSLPDVLKAAHAHRGASFVEIYQNCVVYNDDVFASFTSREIAADKQLWLQPGEKMLFAGGAKGPRARHGAPRAEGRRRRRSGGAGPRAEEQGCRGRC